MMVMVRICPRQRVSSVYSLPRQRLVPMDSPIRAPLGGLEVLCAQWIAEQYKFYY
jgi:hypothetical protein